jgi:hypothetical protein
LAKCLLAKCMLAKCLLAKCMLAKCQSDKWFRPKVVKLRVDGEEKKFL